MKPASCQTCRQPTINAWDDHGIDVAIDPAPLTVRGECIAVLAGRTTWQIVPPSKRHPAEVWRRLDWHIGRPTQPGGRLHAAHVCDQPVPDDWRLPPDPAALAITHQPTDEGAPF